MDPIRGGNALSSAPSAAPASPPPPFVSEPRDEVVASSPASPPPPPSEPRDEVAASPITMVAVGDSLTAGMQDGICREDRQKAGYVALVAAAAGVPMNLPLIVNGSVPPAFFSDTAFDVKHALELRKQLIRQVAPLALYLEYLGMPTDYSAVWTLPGMGHRDPATRDTSQHPQHNFAVSGFELRHMNDVRSEQDYVREVRDFLEEKSELVVRLPGVREILLNGQDAPRGSAVDQAIAKKPDVVVFWGGANDALAAATGGVVDDRTLTPVTDQIWDFNHQDLVTQAWVRRQTDFEVKGFYSALLGEKGAITRLLAETKAEIALLNLPNVTTIPFLKPVGQPLGRLPFQVILPDGTDATERLERFVVPTRVKGDAKGGRSEFPPDSFAGLTPILGSLVAGRTVNTMAELEAAMQEVTAEGAFTEQDVLDADELQAVQERIDDYNRVIALAARRSSRIHLIDARAALDQIHDEGRDLRGDGPPVRVTTTFTGAPTPDGKDGVFSFDGFHPSHTGQAVIANLVLDKLRADLGGQPKFACFRDAKAVDEKAIYLADPHRTARPAFILAPENVGSLASNIGATTGGQIPKPMR